MNKFKNKNQIISFLLSVIKSGEKLTEKEEKEILDYIELSSPKRKLKKDDKIKVVKILTPEEFENPDEFIGAKGIIIDIDKEEYIIKFNNEYLENQAMIYWFGEEIELDLE